MLMSPEWEERLAEVAKTMQQGRYVLIDEPRSDWWTDAKRSGLLFWLEEEMLPVKVVGGGSVFYFNQGIDRKKVEMLVTQLYKE